MLISSIDGWVELWVIWALASNNVGVWNKDSILACCICLGGHTYAMPNRWSAPLKNKKHDKQEIHLHKPICDHWAQVKIFVSVKTQLQHGLVLFWVLINKQLQHATQWAFELLVGCWWSTCSWFWQNQTLFPPAPSLHAKLGQFTPSYINKCFLQ